MRTRDRIKRNSNLNLQIIIAADAALFEYFKKTDSELTHADAYRVGGLPRVSIRSLPTRESYADTFRSFRPIPISL